jgi:aminomethyltransferase
MATLLRQQQDVLLHKVGVADLTHRGLLQVAGPEAGLFLHGMVTNEVKGLRPGQGNHSTVIHSRGRMLGDCRVLVLEPDRIWIDLPGDAKDPVAQHLDQYLISEDCELTDWTGQWFDLGVWGPEAGGLLAALFGTELPSLEEHHHRFLPWQDGEVLVVGSRLFGVAGYELWAAREQVEALWGELVAGAEARGGGVVGDEALDSFRILQGLPRWGKELQESTIPLEANLQGAISYTKGCYIGQEVIAKATYRGAVRRRLARFELSQAVAEGTSLLDGEVLVGTLTSVGTESPDGGGPSALGYLRRDRLEKGREFALEGGGAATVAWVPEEKDT